VAGAGVVYDVEADGIIQLGPNQLPRPGYRDNPLTPANPNDPTYATPIYIIMEGGVG
jgi:hypothetical protein